MRKGVYDILQHSIIDSIRIRENLLADEALQQIIAEVAESWINAFRQGGKVLFCGNGGSAADAQHLAAELSGRFYLDREPLPAEALHVNTSFLTAVANDYDFETAYERLLGAFGQAGDILVALSTSGNSPNILRAAKEARRKGLTVVGMTGKGGGKLAALTDLLINVPSNDTPRIQELHMLVGHALCQYVEMELFGDPG